MPFRIYNSMIKNSFPVTPSYLFPPLQYIEIKPEQLNAAHVLYIVSHFMPGHYHHFRVDFFNVPSNADVDH